jgi:type IX secretion system PorP/SprF family membrane protein
MQKKLFIYTIMMCFSVFLKAQDAHFSQFYMTPLLHNPAQIGVFKGSGRATANYRSQWGNILDKNPFRTVAGSYEAKIQVSKDDYMGISGDVLGDQAGPAKFSQFQGHLGASYQKRVSGGGKRGRYKRSSNDQYISAGFQIGVGQYTMDADKFWYSSQFDDVRVDVDYNAASGEATGAYNSNLYANLNAGLMWYALFDDNKSLYIGGALNHANAPTIRFNGNFTSNEVLKWRFVGQIGGEMPFSDELSLLPAFVIQNQGQNQQMLAGTHLRYNAHDWREVALRAGLWTRIANYNTTGKHVDALIVSSILEMDKINIGLSYDINVSKLNAVSNYRGAFEISVQYIQAERQRRNKVICPRF